MDQPRWLAEAWAEFGVREIAGPASEARILALYRDAGHGPVRSDDVPWCAAFVGACLKRAGLPHTGSLMARSYARWGEAAEGHRIGAVAVLTRGADPALGHVGFLMGRTGSKIFILGGNQNNSVSVAAFDASRLIALRWPVEAQIQAPPANVFEAALKHVLEMEGGYSDDPHDPGGPTNKGILLREYAAWKGITPTALNTASLKRELRAIPDEVVRAIYLKKYWEPALCGELAAPLALMHFDAAVNHGTGAAIRMLQEAAGSEADGELGPLTRAALARQPLATTLARYGELRRKRYRALPHFWRFGRGWLNRVERTTATARTLFPRPDTQATSIETGENPMAKDLTNDITGSAEPKWWGQSLTIWGVVITALSSVVPALAPVIGVDIPADMVQDAGGQVVSTVQAITGLAGTLLAIFGRIRAKQPLSRREMSLRL